MWSTISSFPLLTGAAVLTALAAVFLSLWVFVSLRRKFNELQKTLERFRMESTAQDPGSKRAFGPTPDPAGGKNVPASKLELMDERVLHTGSHAPEEGGKQEPSARAPRTSEDLPVNEDRLNKVNSSFGESAGNDSARNNTRSRE